MSLTDLAGATYGPVSLTVSRAKVAEYVDVTGDDQRRWVDHAPPSYAGALLFVLAPQFLWSHEVRAYTKVLVHSDQRFQWHRPLAIGEWVEVSAAVERVRARRAVHFVTFTAAVADADGPLLDSQSTFLMAAAGSPDPGPDEGEPPVAEAAPSEAASPRSHRGPGSVLAPLAKSASRVDLVRYAGASGDFNPIHYDHDTARAAGFGGVIVHGLLMGAWAAQLAAAMSDRPDPLAELRLRFKEALRPGGAVTVTGRVEESADGLTRVALAISTDDTQFVTGRALVREG